MNVQAEQSSRRPEALKKNGDSSMLAILGGGLAGLAIGYYARKRGMASMIYERSNHPGGNSVTYTWDGFRFDSGAHRIHDRNAEVMYELKSLFKDQLVKTAAPSYICHRNRLIRFPLDVRSALSGLKAIEVMKAMVEYISGCRRQSRVDENFREYSERKYGKTAASLFITNYSRKLWGTTTENLSKKIAGERFRDLNVKALLVESLFGKHGSSTHMEGAFYYPNGGIGVIAEKLAESCRSSFQTNSETTRVFWQGDRICGIQINGTENIAVDQLVSTLPLNDFIGMLDPPPEARILRAAQNLKFRHLRLAAFFVRKKSILNAASIYFPDDRYPFTRVYEPRNRSSTMSPDGASSLVAELPCWKEDEVWSGSERDILNMVYPYLEEAFNIKHKDLLGSEVKRMVNAYPVLEFGIEKSIEGIFDFLKEFKNLRFSGRSGRFKYAWIHDMLSWGKTVADEDVIAH